MPSELRFIGQSTWMSRMTHHDSREPLPVSLRDPSIRRAYLHLEGNRDEPMAQAHALKPSPDCKNMRQVFQGFLCGRDISLEAIALLLELDAEVVKLSATLFFNVRERGGRMLALPGHLDWKESPGIRHGKTWMMRPKPDAQAQPRH